MFLKFDYFLSYFCAFFDIQIFYLIQNIKNKCFFQIQRLYKYIHLSYKNTYAYIELSENFLMFVMFCFTIKSGLKKFT